MIKMQDKKQVFAKFILEQVYDRWREEMEEIDKRYNQNSENIKQELIQRFEEVCQKSFELQQLKSKGPIKYIYISFLKTSLIEGKSLYRLETYDENWFLDKTECYSLWNSDFIFSSLFKHMEDLKLKKNEYFGVITDIEIDRIKFLESVKYHYIAMSFIEESVNLLVSNLKYKQMEKSKDICILVGEYMDSSKIIYRDNGVED